MPASRPLRARARGQEVHGGRDVVAAEGAAARGPEPLHGSPGQAARARVRRPELEAQPDGLLEVVADDLLDLGQPLGGVALHPVGEPLVEERAGLLRHRLVGDVADQSVPEAVAVLRRRGGRVRANELLAHERE